MICEMRRICRDKDEADVVVDGSGRVAALTMKSNLSWSVGVGCRDRKGE